jgi:hypothetical protein
MVKWSIFSRPNAEKGKTLMGAIEEEAKKVERFAPKQYEKERRVHYYNYRLLHQYLKPLHDLLSSISEARELAKRGDLAPLLQSLFLGIKNFYDPKQTLTLEEALQSKELRRKLRRLLLIFFNIEEVTDSGILSCLREKAGMPGPEERALPKGRP